MHTLFSLTLQAFTERWRIVADVSSRPQIEETGHAAVVSAAASNPVQLSREGHSTVFLFGVEHYSLQVEPAEFILKHNPAAVVFENSFSASGGNGAIVDCEDSTSLDGSHLVAMACETAARMQSSPPAVFDHVWQQLKQQCETELLGHMAAFIIGTKVVHADRPKVDTYLRLDELVSAADLDLAIEAQVCINHADFYADMQRQLSPLPAEAVHPYALTQELYGSPRMLLAMLPPEHLHKACSGWNCDMWDVLKPVRDVRPRYGGPGLDEELLWELRQLYFDLG
ncbi:hypothetical protein WJX82_000636 [Trebouxia sp. C0006]